MPNALYHIDPYAAAVETTITGVFEEEGRKYVVLEDRLFYPQGGGQKGDRGVVRVDAVELEIVDTVKDPYSSDGGPMLVVNGTLDGLGVGVTAHAELDWDHRFKQMRLHGAVHMHHCMMEEILGEAIPHPKTSDIQDDGSAFNRYETDLVNEGLAMQAAAQLMALIETGAPVVTEDDDAGDGSRWWRCHGHDIPCGGTHVRDMHEVGGLSVAYSQKKRKPKITISLG